MVRRQGEEEDPFANIDLAVDTTEIETIMPHIQADSCPVSEYLAGDDDILIRKEFDNEHWEEFLSSLTSSREPVSADSGNEDNYDIEELPVFKVRNMSEAILNLEDMSRFLDSRGHCKEATVIASALDMITDWSP